MRGFGISHLPHRSADRLELRGPQLLDPGGREREQLVERRPRERRALGRGLHLDDLLVLAADGIAALRDVQEQVLAAAAP